MKAKEFLILGASALTLCWFSACTVALLPSRRKADLCGWRNWKLILRSVITPLAFYAGWPNTMNAIHDGKGVVAEDLELAGIPKSDIVLGFHPADVRPHTEYAIG